MFRFSSLIVLVGGSLAAFLLLLSGSITPAPSAEAWIFPLPDKSPTPKPTATPPFTPSVPVPVECSQIAFQREYIMGPAEVNFDEGLAFGLGNTAPRTLVIGNALNNDIKVYGPADCVSAGDGDDVVTIDADYGYAKSPVALGGNGNDTLQSVIYNHSASMYFYGGPDDDILIGSDDPDYLDGGPGFDTAGGGNHIGGQGDRCVNNEVESGCEYHF